PAKGQLVNSAPELHSGIVIGCKRMGNAEAVQVGSQPEPRVVGAWRLESSLGKKECKAIDCGSEEIWALSCFLPIQIGHFRQCNHLILVAAALGGDRVQRGDRARRIVIVALRENPAAQDDPGLWAEL